MNAAKDGDMAGGIDAVCADTTVRGPAIAGSGGMNAAKDGGMAGGIGVACVDIGADA